MRLKEIEERLAAIKNELTTRAAELKEEEITALENEVQLYRKRERQLRQQQKSVAHCLRELQQAKA